MTRADMTTSTQIVETVVFVIISQYLYYVGRACSIL